MDSSLGNNNSVGGGGGKRKIEDAVELAKQKAQAIAARLLNDADSKRPRTDSSPPSQQPDFPVPYTANQTPHYNYNGAAAAAAAAGLPTSKKIQIPNAKVGVIIGRGGDMIKTLQLESGARFQITRDADADPSSFTRDVDLMGTPDQIARAEQRIHEVIAETDATSSASSALRGASTPQPPTAAAGADQFVMKVPNDKVALVIGKGGETIKMMQGRSGARIQVVPLHLPPGDTSTERNIFINGTKEQIDSAKELVNEVISGNRLKVMSGTNMYQQPGYPPSAGWAPQGQPSAQQPPAYGYTQPGAYAMPPPPYYSGYPPQPAAWDQSAATPQQQSTAYSAYGQAQPPSSTPPNVNYNYSQVPPAAGYNYNQGYPQQQPSYGQDTSDQTKAYANPAYAPSATSTQPDGSNSVQTPQPSYGAPAAIPGQPDGTAQTQPPSAYAAAYSQPPAAPANGYNAYPSYSGAAPVQPVYNQTGYPLTGYGQQQDAQIASQASYAYYGQSGLGSILGLPWWHNSGSLLMYDMNGHNLPETIVRNEAVGDFLTLLKEWQKLCASFNLIQSKITHEKIDAMVEEEDDDDVEDDSDENDDQDDEIFEVEEIIGICYGDPKKINAGLYFKVRWKGYGPSEDSWEPVDGLGNCRAKIGEFVKKGYRERVLPLPGDVDVICGGPPCQGISGFNRFRNTANPLADPKNEQLVVFMDVVNYLKPKHVLMENVVDIVKFSKGFLGRYALGRLVDMNYQARMGMMAAGAYGLPQFRMRVFIWGAQPSEQLPQYPLPTHDLVLRGVIPTEFEINTVAYNEGHSEQLANKLYLGHAISDLPEVTNAEHRDEMPYSCAPETEFQRFIRMTKDAMLGSNVGPELISKLYDHRALELNNDDFQRVCRVPKRKGANFRDLRVRADNKVEWDPAVPRVLLLPSGKPLVPDYAMTFVGGKPFGRLWWDETVPTVVTRAEPHNQVVLHPLQDRVLTIRENARLQGFPDYYQLKGPVEESGCPSGACSRICVGNGQFRVLVMGLC